MFDQTPDPTLAAEVCCKLINAYLAGHESVEWADVQKALNIALEALDLPQSTVVNRSERDMQR